MCTIMFIIYLLMIILGIVAICNWSEEYDLYLRGLGIILIFIGTILMFCLLIPDIKYEGVRAYLSNPESFEIDTITHSNGNIEYEVICKSLD